MYVRGDTVGHAVNDGKTRIPPHHPPTPPARRKRVCVTNARRLSSYCRTTRDARPPRRSLLRRCARRWPSFRCVPHVVWAARRRDVFTRALLENVCVTSPLCAGTTTVTHVSVVCVDFPSSVHAMFSR